MKEKAETLFLKNDEKHHNCKIRTVTSELKRSYSLIIQKKEQNGNERDHSGTNRHDNCFRGHTRRLDWFNRSVFIRVVLRVSNSRDFSKNFSFRR
jgi:hypothetical protein